MALVTADHWKKEVSQKLISTYKSTDIKGLALLLYCLDQSRLEYGSLRFLVKSEATFRFYSQRLINTAKKYENEFHNSIGHFLRDQSQENRNTTFSFNFKELPELLLNITKRLSNLKGHEVCGLAGLIEGWSYIPVDAQRELITLYLRTTINHTGVAAAPVAELISGINVTPIVVGLLVAKLGYDIYVSIQKWLNNEILGVDCCKIIIDEIILMTSGAGGGLIGAWIGFTCGGGLGAVIGGAGGGIICAYIGYELSDRLTRWLFSLPPNEAIENAYKFCDISSNQEINAAFQYRYKLHNENSVEYFETQVNMCIIALSRDEYENLLINGELNS